MNWWRRLLGARGNASLDRLTFRVPFTLYSEDGQRQAEVREFSNGQTYPLERERDEKGVIVARHSSSLVGPFRSPKAAQRFIVRTDWFAGGNRGWLGRTRRGAGSRTS